MDSTALYALFPEAYVIHEQSLNPSGSAIIDNSTNVIDYINKKQGKGISFSNNNRRTISRPSGWASWASCVANALLLSTDLNIGYIFTGTVMGSSFLWNGSKYFPGTDPKRKNRWVRAFETIGIPLVYATSGLTEIGNAIVLQKKNLLDIPVWCTYNNGETAINVGNVSEEIRF